MNSFYMLMTKQVLLFITSPGGERKLGLPFSDLQQKVALSKTFGTIRSVTSSIKSATVNAAATAAGQVRIVITIGNNN